MCMSIYINLTGTYTCLVTTTNNKLYAGIHPCTHTCTHTCTHQTQVYSKSSQLVWVFWSGCRDVIYSSQGMLPQEFHFCVSFRQNQRNLHLFPHLPIVSIMMFYLAFYIWINPFCLRDSAFCVSPLVHCCQRACMKWN